MEVLGHQDPANEQAVHLLPDFFEALDEVLAKAWREENRRSAVDAGGNELQLTRAVNAMIDGHAAFEYTRSDGLREGVRSGLSRQNENVLFQQSRNVLLNSVKLNGWKNRRC
jgi:hypothetical protein